MFKFLFKLKFLGFVEAPVGVFIHFLIFRVSNMSYNNIKIDSTSKIAESGGHEHVMLSFFVQGSEHSLLTQQENEGLVYQI